MVFKMAANKGHCYEQIEAIADSLKAKAGVSPIIGLIGGSGLGGLVSVIENRFEIPYSDIEGFVPSTVQGHAGTLVFGTIKSKPVVCMNGRIHFYEGYSMQQITLPVRVMALLGVKVLIITNACGGFNANFKTGDIMVIKNHCSFATEAGMNPLIGSNDERFGVRFPDLTYPYDIKLQKLALNCAKKLDIESSVQNGVYGFFSGPCYSSMPDLKLMQLVGADVGGMSTVPETVVARHSNMKVMGLSVLSNSMDLSSASYDPPDETDEPVVTHEEVLESMKQSTERLCTLIQEIIGDIHI